MVDYNSLTAAKMQHRFEILVAFLHFISMWETLVILSFRLKACANKENVINLAAKSRLMLKSIWGNLIHYKKILFYPL